jgi:hypothetical protein
VLLSTLLHAISYRGALLSTLLYAISYKGAPLSTLLHAISYRGALLSTFLHAISYRGALLSTLLHATVYVYTQFAKCTSTDCKINWGCKKPIIQFSRKFGSLINWQLYGPPWPSTAIALVFLVTSWKQNYIRILQSPRLIPSKLLTIHYSQSNLSSYVTSCHHVMKHRSQFCRFVDVRRLNINN